MTSPLHQQTATEAENSHEELSKMAKLANAADALRKAASTYDLTIEEASSFIIKLAKKRA